MFICDCPLKSWPSVNQCSVASRGVGVGWGSVVLGDSQLGLVLILGMRKNHMQVCGDQRGRCKTTRHQSQNNHAPVLGQGKGCVKVEALHLLLLVPGDGLSATESEIGPGPRTSVHLPSPEHQACLPDF